MGVKVSVTIREGYYFALKMHVDLVKVKLRVQVLKGGHADQKIIVPMEEGQHLVLREQNPPMEAQLEEFFLVKLFLWSVELAPVLLAQS